MVRRKKTNSKYRSKFEETVTDQLRLLKVEHEYETVKLKYNVPQTENCYTPDVILPNGIHCELKGLFDLADRKKILNVIRCNPTVDLRLVFQRSINKISKGSPTTYAMWCDKNNIKWGVPSDIINWSKEKSSH